MTDSEFNVVGGPAQPVADQLAIQSLLYQYCHLVDRGSVDQIVALFAEDAVLHPPYLGPSRLQGRAAIRAWFQDYDDQVRAKRTHRRHRVTTPFIKIDGNTAQAWCYLDSSAVLTDAAVLNVSAGRYEDQLVKRRGTWLFSERNIILNHIHTIAEFTEPD